MADLLTSNEIDRKIGRIMAIIDREGQPPLPIEDWMEILVALKSQIDSRIVAAKEDLRRG